MPANTAGHALIPNEASRTISNMKNAKPPTKHQIKSEATRAALLLAAEEIFARDGFERAQIDEIAKKSGRTRGAVYAQYKTKEQLFFALIEQRMETAVREFGLLTVETREDDFAARLAALRKYYSEPKDPQGAILELELKLYALRHPESIAELREHYKRIHPKGGAAEYFGIRQETARSRVDNRILSLSALRSGLMLAMLFEPDLFSVKEVRLMLGEVFDGLFPEAGKVQGKARKAKRK
jgi:AcrR family transcriptional regulator